ncbi:MAG TPA: MBL fold metallo-hydrolase [Gaiellaceae bacterium]|nr:MBL fold metallo-hydrolase [Gaiellaceae bacterium]
MSPTADHVIGVDLANVFDAEGEYVATLAWGDAVELVERRATGVTIAYTTFVPDADGLPRPVRRTGVVRRGRSGAPPLAEAVVPKAEHPILKVEFVDVQQGDASVIETPGGRVLLVDGGDNPLFARYLAARFAGSTAEAPRPVEALLVTHGDADHFSGLVKVLEAERAPVPRQRVFLRPRRVLHNGLVKRPDSVRERDRLGPTVDYDGRVWATGLVDDLLAVPDAELNRPFRAWKRALRTWNERSPLELVRLERGRDAPFAELRADGVKVEVLGPLPEVVGGVPALPLLGEPRETPRIGLPSVRPPSTFTGVSAAHTINGHSVVFRLTYGKWRFLYAGDLNEQAELDLVDAHRRGEVALRAEVLKVPHHGSADFLPEFIDAVAPVVSVVSSGDESARKEYVHPRATLVSALGQHARGAEPLVFVTELVAFFEVVGPAVTRRGRPFFAFERRAFGLVKVRTDGERLLVWTNSGQTRLKEAYAYTLDRGRPVAVPVRRL